MYYTKYEVYYYEFYDCLTADGDATSLAFGSVNSIPSSVSLYDSKFFFLLIEEDILLIFSIITEQKKTEFRCAANIIRKAYRSLPLYR